MGLHVTLDQEGISACRECQMMIVDGEDGCIEYAENLFKLFIQKYDADKVTLLQYAYKLQHYQHYASADEEAVRMLGTIFAVNAQDKTEFNVLEQDVVETILEEVFFYQRDIPSIITVDMFEHADNDKRDAMLCQYLLDVCERYSEYEEIIMNKLR